MSTNVFTGEMSDELLHHVLGLDWRYGARGPGEPKVQRRRKDPADAVLVLRAVLGERAGFITGPGA